MINSRNSSVAGRKSSCSEDLLKQLNEQNHEALGRVREELESLRDLLLASAIEPAGDQTNISARAANDTATMNAEPTGESQR